MHFNVDTRSAQPIYAQIVEQVRQGLAQQTLVPGDRLPSIRDLALELKVNRNTVAHAYRELKNRGWIQTSGPRGAYITEQASTVSDLDRGLWLRQRVDAFVEELTRLGYAPSVIATAVAERIAASDPDSTRRNAP
jgi:GntR family transcriptional regulator